MPILEFLASSAGGPLSQKNIQGQWSLFNEIFKIHSINWCVYSASISLGTIIV